jgi:hypothetical protein
MLTRPAHVQRRRIVHNWLWLPALASLLAMGLGPSYMAPSHAPALERRPPAAPAPVGAVNNPLYLPMVSTYQITPVNLVNGSFEERETWFTDYTHGGNQWPRGWDFYSTENGVVMPFPTKHQEGSIVPAIAGGWGEYVHKLAEWLPPEEHAGGPRGVIVDGWTTYKAFSAAIPQALRLSQVLTGTPGALMQVTGYILGETFDYPSPPNTKLEDDHFIASVQLGSAADTRTYAIMVQHLDVPGNERHWNKFVVTAVVPPSGQLLLQVITQQNWAGRTDFFIDAFSAVQIQ